MNDDYFFSAAKKDMYYVNSRGMQPAVPVYFFEKRIVVPGTQDDDICLEKSPVKHYITCNTMKEMKMLYELISHIIAIEENQEGGWS